MASAAAAIAKIEAGATLLQLYTGLVFRARPHCRIKRAILQYVDHRKLAPYTSYATCCRAAEWASRPLEQPLPAATIMTTNAPSGH